MSLSHLIFIDSDMESDHIEKNAGRYSEIIRDYVQPLVKTNWIVPGAIRGYQSNDGCRSR